jgi:hypothetical protein
MRAFAGARTTVRSRSSLAAARAASTCSGGRDLGDTRYQVGNRALRIIAFPDFALGGTLGNKPREFTPRNLDFSQGAVYCELVVRRVDDKKNVALRHSRTGPK